jgi:hypothetical protein
MRRKKRVRSMKRLPIFLLLGALVLGSLVVGCRDENDPEYWLDYMYDRPWREKSLKTLNEIFSRTMQENENNLENPTVKKLIDLMLPELKKGFREFTRDKFNRTEIIKLLAQMKDPRAVDVFLEGLSSAEAGDAMMFQVSANAVQRQGAEQGIPKLLAAHQKIVADRSRRPGAPFTNSENEIEQAVISAASGIILKSPGSGQKAAVVKILCDIAETSDELQELRLNMKAMKALGRIGDPAAIPTLIKGIAFKGKRQPIGLGQIAFSALLQMHNRDAVVGAMLNFAKREDKAFNQYYAEEMRRDPLMMNPTWYIQQTDVFFGMLNYASPKVIAFLESELNHDEPDALDEETSRLDLQVQFDPGGWAMMRRNWAAVALAELGHHPLVKVIKRRMEFKKGKLSTPLEEAVGYVRAMGLLLYPDETCDILLKTAKDADDSLRDKTYYNASLMCGDKFMRAIQKAHNNINCDEIVAKRFPGDSGTEDEKKSAYNECDIMKKRLQGYADDIQYGTKCGNNVACHAKEVEAKASPHKERAIFSLYRIARDNPGKRDEVVKLLIKNLDNPSKAAMNASVFALDRLTPNGSKELVERIQEVHRKIKLSYKAEARMLESFIGRVRNRGLK